MPTIHLPTPLRPYAEGRDAVACSGATVGEALADLTNRYAGLKKHLFDENGQLRSFVNVYKNDEDVRFLDRDKTPVSEADKLLIIPAIAGG